MSKLGKIIETLAPPAFSFGALCLIMWGFVSIKSCQMKEFEKRQKEYLTIFNQQPIYAQVLEEKYISSFQNVEKEGKLSGGGIGVGSGGIGFFGGEGTLKYEGLENKNSYLLKVKTKEGKVFGISVFDGITQTKEGLDAIVSPGSRISIIPGNVEPGEIRDGMIHQQGYKVINQETNITKDINVASKRADRIKVL